MNFFMELDTRGTNGGGIDWIW